MLSLLVSLASSEFWVWSLWSCCGLMWTRLLFIFCSSLIYLGKLIPEALIIDDMKCGIQLLPACDSNSDFCKFLNGGQKKAQDENDTVRTGRSRRESFQNSTQYYLYLPVLSTTRLQPFTLQGRGQCLAQMKDVTTARWLLSVAVGWCQDDLTTVVKSACKRLWKNRKDEK